MSERAADFPHASVRLPRPVWFGATIGFPRANTITLLCEKPNIMLGRAAAGQGRTSRDATAKDPRELSAYVASETTRWKSVIEKAAIKID